MTDLSQFVNELNAMLQPSTMSTEVKPDNTVVVPSSKVKILIVSTHINQVNGYSKVAYNLIQPASVNMFSTAKTGDNISGTIKSRHL